VSETPFTWDSYTILGALATATSKISLGPGVTNPYIRHPHHLAMSTRTLDRISEGRSFLGIGRSVPEWYSRYLGLEIGDPVNVMRNTLSRLKEFREESNRVLRDEEYSVTSPTPHPLEVEYNCPIYIAAVGPRMIEVAIEFGNGLVFCWPTVEFLERTIPMVKASLERHGRDPEKFKFAVQTGFEVTTNKTDVLEAMKAEMAYIYRFDGIGRAFRSPCYDIERISLELRKNYAGAMKIVEGTSDWNIHRSSRLEIIRGIIPAGLVDEVGFIGTIDEIKKKLGSYKILGVTDMFVPPPQIDDRATDYKIFVNQLNDKI
ncbi:uncharacterized protein METZ01_LOCUS197282, partial [marine metagenome]